MTMASPIVVCESLITDLTCSICHELYKTPKILPTCDHTFCLACLESITLGSRPFATVQCPDCSQLSYVTTQVKDFATSSALEKVVDKVKKVQQKCQNQDIGNKEVPVGIIVDIDDADLCVHADKQQCEECRHCQQVFCNACKFRHIDKLRDELTTFLKAYDEMLLKNSVVDVAKKIERILKEDMKGVEAKLEEAFLSLLCSVVESIRSKKKKIVNLGEKLVAVEMSRVDEMLALASSDVKQSFKSRLQQLMSVSVFRLNLDDVAQLYLEISSAKEAVDTLSCLMKPNLEERWLEFRPSSDTDNLVRCLDALSIGTLSPTKFALSGGCWAQAGDEESRSIFSSSKATQTDPPAVEKEESAATPFHNVVMSVASRFATKLLALHNHGVFVLLSVLPKQNQFIFFTPENAVVVTTPPSWNYEIEDIATDNGKTIFAVAVARDTDFVNIYRFWVSDASPNQAPNEPTIFAFGHRSSSTCFNGLAVSTKLRWLFTTTGDYVVAYESIDFERNMLACHVAKWHVGPRPYVLATEDDYDKKAGEKATALVFLADGYLQNLSINLKNEKISFPVTAWLPDNNTLTSSLFQVKQPSDFCNWKGGNVLLRDGDAGDFYHIGDVFSKPKFIAKFPANFSVPELPKTVNSIAVLPSLTTGGKATIAALFPGVTSDHDKTIVFAELKNMTES